MDALDLPESSSIFGSGSASAEPDSDTVEDFLAQNPSVRLVRQSSARFSALRTAMARDAERNVALACSTFAHSLEGTMKGSVQWAGVGFYYTAYYAARAIVLTAGVWYARKKLWIDVDRSRTDRIGFRINRIPHSIVITGRGPHKDFWSFYQLVATRIAADIGAEYGWAVVPALTDVDHLHDLRLELNYNTKAAIDSALEYTTIYKTGEYGNWISGRAATLYQYGRAYLGCAIERAQSIGLNEDVFGNELSGRRDFATKRLDWVRNDTVQHDVHDRLL